MDSSRYLSTADLVNFFHQEAFGQWFLHRRLFPFKALLSSFLSSSKGERSWNFKRSVRTYTTIPGGLRWRSHVPGRNNASGLWLTLPGLYPRIVLPSPRRSHKATAGLLTSLSFFWQDGGHGNN